MTEHAKKRFPPDSVCKPCWELRYCPYGSLVEFFPSASPNVDLDQVQARHRQAFENLKNGSLESDDEVWKEAETLIALMPQDVEYICQFDPTEVNCRVWGHVCPVFLVQSAATETKESRRSSRYIPRPVMLKVVRRDNHVCQNCQKYVRDDEIEFDHIIPVSRGGPTTVDNLRLLCRTCNRAKSNSMKDLLSEE